MGCENTYPDHGSDNPNGKQQSQESDWENLRARLGSGDAMEGPALNHLAHPSTFFRGNHDLQNDFRIAGWQHC